MSVQDLTAALAIMLTQSVPGTTHAQAIEELLKALKAAADDEWAVLERAHKKLEAEEADNG